MTYADAKNLKPNDQVTSAYTGKAVTVLTVNDTGSEICISAVSREHGYVRLNHTAVNHIAGNHPYSAWRPFDNGASKRKLDSHDVHTLADEEYKYACRLTMTRIRDDAMGFVYEIPCSIYGVMVHTASAPNMLETAAKYESMRRELTQFIETNPDNIAAWCTEFVKKY